MQRFTVKYLKELEDSYGRVRGKTVDSEVHRISTGRVTWPISWTLGDSQRRKYQQKSIHRQLGLPCTYIAEMQLSLHSGLEQLEQGLSLNLLPVCGICSHNSAFFSGFSGRRSTKSQSYKDLMFQGEGITGEETSLFQRRRGVERG